MLRASRGTSPFASTSARNTDLHAQERCVLGSYRNRVRAKYKRKEPRAKVLKLASEVFVR
jgi:hypothetical protein